jgi:hypothetical protein
VCSLTPPPPSVSRETEGLDCSSVEAADGGPDLVVSLRPGAILAPSSPTAPFSARSSSPARPVPLAVGCRPRPVEVASSVSGSRPDTPRGPRPESTPSTPPPDGATPPPSVPAPGSRVVGAVVRRLAWPDRAVSTPAPASPTQATPSASSSNSPPLTSVPATVPRATPASRWSGAAGACSAKSDSACPEVPAPVAASPAPLTPQALDLDPPWSAALAGGAQAGAASTEGPAGWSGGAAPESAAGPSASGYDRDGLAGTPPPTPRRRSHWRPSGASGRPVRSLGAGAAPLS